MTESCNGSGYIIHGGYTLYTVVIVNIIVVTNIIGQARSQGGRCTGYKCTPLSYLYFNVLKRSTSSYLSTHTNSKMWTFLVRGIPK